MSKNIGPNPMDIYPNENIKSVCFIKNTIKNPNIQVGDYTYYSDINGCEDFEKHVTHHYDFIGDSAIIAANSTITKDVLPYHIVGGNPAKIIRRRFDDSLVSYLLDLKWWDWDKEKIFSNLEILCSADLGKIKSIL